jgi:hypothetical protein
MTKLEELKAARSARNHDFIMNLPDGYETACAAADDAWVAADDAARDAAYEGSYSYAADAAYVAAWDAYYAELKKIQERRTLMTKLEELRAARDAADACVVDACADASATKAAAWDALDVYATAKADYDAAGTAYVAASANKAAAVRAAKDAKAAYNRQLYYDHCAELRKIEEENSDD